MATESWVARIRSGCREAFSQWVDLQQEKLLRYARRKLGNGDDAMDAIQETFVAAFHGRDQVPPDRDQQQAWLFGIARHKVLDQLRSRSRSRSREAPDADPASQTPSRLDTARAAEERLEVRQVLDALAVLEEPYREALTLVSVEGYSYEEVAALQGVPRGTVRSRISTARKLLRAALAKQERQQALGVSA